MWDNACSWTRTRLPLMAGGELTGSDRRKTERHLIGCSDCRDRLETFRGTVGLLRALGGETGPKPEAPSIWPALALQIRETRREQPVLALWELRPLAWVGASLAACLTLAVGVSWSLSQASGVAALVPQSPANATEVRHAAFDPAKSKAETPSLVEAPRRDDGLTSEPSNRPPGRNVNLPGGATRPPVEAATH